MSYFFRNIARVSDVLISDGRDTEIRRDTELPPRKHEMLLWILKLLAGQALCCVHVMC